MTSRPAPPRFNVPPFDNSVDRGELDRRVIEKIIDDRIDQVFRWRTWTPVYTSLTVGNGTVDAQYLHAGRLVIAYFSLLFGSTTSIDADGPEIGAPVPANGDYLNNRTTPGGAWIKAAGANYNAFARFPTATTIEIVSVNHVAHATYSRPAEVTSTAPGTFTTDDVLQFMVTYEAAS